jgi:alkanesulfonate monooxygenase SsuD/methylene tetrahydromethanopterin reductase-like flavin-dependent oxidoreductase (luciferase family)
MTVELVALYTSATVDPREFARSAEAAGFAGVGCSDHLFRTSAYPHVWVALSAMAQVTERVVLTSSFANNLFRSPVEFAQASLTMQWLSGGRFEAGLGAGWLEPEVRAMGFDYPPPSVRARRYREAMQVVRQLFDTGRCTFAGEHYTVDMPVIGPVHAPRPPLVASVGGSWTIEHVAPLADRVELVFGGSTRGGDLDMSVLAHCTRAELARMVDGVRSVAPDVRIGLMAMIAVGDERDVAPLREPLGDGLYAGFVGERDHVLANLHALADLGISREQLYERAKGSIERLGEVG